MRKTINNLLKAFIIVLLLSIAYSVEASSPPPPPGEETGSTNTYGNSLNGGVPIESGLLILLALGVAYGGRKLYNIYKKA